MKKGLCLWVIALSRCVIAACPADPGTKVSEIRVRVMRPEGAPVKPLTAADFVLEAEPRSTPDLRFLRPTVDQRLSAFFLDTSRSMGSGRIFKMPQLAIAGINSFLETSSAQDEYFIEYVSNAPVMKCDFSCARPHIDLRNAPRAHGGTALTGAIYLALNGMRRARYENRALLIVSDGAITPAPTI